MIVTVGDEGVHVVVRLEHLLEPVETRTRGDGRHLEILVDELAAALPPSCPAVEAAFDGFVFFDPVDTCPSVPRKLSAALIECGCDNEDEILTLLYGLVVDTIAHEHPAVVVVVVLDPTATPWSGGTWGDIVSALDAEDLQRLWVVE